MEVTSINGNRIDSMDTDTLKEYSSHIERIIKIRDDGPLYTMTLSADKSHLSVSIGPWEILTIDTEGVIELNQSTEAVDALDGWRLHGFNVKDYLVNFNGARFSIKNNKLIEGDGIYNIFNFGTMLACSGCEYTGVNKHSRTDTPIVYINY